MANYKNDGSKIPRITFAVPPELVFATEALASAEYSTVSAVCRRALAETLMSRGYLSGDEEA